MTGRPGPGRRLAAATGVAAVGLAAGGTAGPLLAAELAGDEAAGWPITALTAGGALTAPLIAAVASRRDRLAALRVGHVLGSLGAVAGILAVLAGSLALLLVASVALGGGNTAIFLARYAAAALARPERLARAMSAVLIATAVGATLSPLLLGPTGALATALGLPAPVGLYLLAATTYTVAAVLLNPSRTATAPTAFVASRAPVAGRFRAIAVLACTNGLMVGVMTVAPVHLAHHGTSTSSIGAIIAAHVAAMFAPAPLTGRLADHAGALTTALLGLAVLATAGITSVQLGSDDATHTTIALLLLGFGWNLGLVGGSTMLAQTTRADARPQLEAIAEAVMGVGAAVSAPLAGLAITNGLRSVWLAEALIAALAATTLAGFHAARPRPANASR